MTHDEIIAYSLKKTGAYIDLPWGITPVCVKVCGRIFVQLWTDKDILTVKCEKESGIFYRTAYPDIILRGYFCPPVQQPYWNSLNLNGGISDDLITAIIDLSYNTVINKLKKYEKASLSDNKD